MPLMHNADNCKENLTIRFIIIISVLSLAISCVKPAGTSPQIPPADMDADYCLDLRSDYAVARLVKKYRDLEPALLNIPEKPYFRCLATGLDEYYYFYFFEKERNGVFDMKSIMTCSSHGGCGTTWKLSPVVQIDFPESEIIDFIDLKKDHKKEDLLQFENKIIDVEIYKNFYCGRISDASEEIGFNEEISVKFRARITGDCGNWPMPTWNIGAGGKDSVVAELSPDERTLVIKGNGKMMDFDFDDLEHDSRPWNEICAKENSKVVIEDGVTHIGKNAFLNCDLVSVTIPGSVTSIGDDAFSNIGIDGSITVLNPVPPRLLGTVFEEFFKESRPLRVPKGSVDAYRKADGWEGFEDIEAIEDEVIQKNTL
jgi:hypothetical protein